MTASDDTKNPLRGNMAAPAVESIFGSPLDGISSQRLFKKHKVLPHPKRDSYASLRRARGPGNNSRQTLRHQPRRIGSEPDLPPTPPAHSRQSSASSHSILPSSPTYVETPEQSTESVRPKAPSTPTNQMSPPTPDVTPPQSHDRRPKVVRPVIMERAASKATTESRTESFKTARETPSDDEEEEEEDTKSTLRPPLPSARTSQTTVRQVSTDDKKEARPVGLGLGLESSPESKLTPRLKREFIAFDGEWGSGSEVEQEWDDNLERNVTVRKRRAPAKVNGHREPEVLEDVTVSPTNATKALRSMTLPERILTFPSPSPKETTPERPKAAPLVSAEPSASDSSISIDVRRFSGMSSKSTVSTVVEAILVDTPPRRQKTLRHVKKKTALRDSGSDLSPTSSAPTSILLDEGSRLRKVNGRPHDRRQDSVASAGTMNSISSGKARREVWRHGSIPVVIVPERRSSIKSSSKTPSLRSTSSRRSKRSQSLSSVPLSHISRSKDLTPYFERPSRRSRAGSESDGSIPGDQRTLDYPPVVPRRTSSLSAPTSRNASRSGSLNGSRNGSLTTASLTAHNALQTQLKGPTQTKTITQSLRIATKAPEVKLERAASVEGPKLTNGRPKEAEPQSPNFLSPERHGRLSAHTTPFSQVSVETNGTSHQSQAEVEEAMAVNIYPHQNTSVLVVDHSLRPFGESDDTPRPPKRSPARNKPLPEAPNGSNPTIKTTDPEGMGPVTPPQLQFSMDDVDSPLRNPRVPPEPPAIKFIPATPSGLTPAHEKQKHLGSYFDDTIEKDTTEKPSRSMSLVRKALSRRRHSSEYGPSASRTQGLLSRSFSFTRGSRKGKRNSESLDSSKTPSLNGYANPDDRPADEGRLHPFWRPASWYQSDDHDGLSHDVEDETYRYPPIDNRPSPPRRSLSERMKRTFAILPLNDADDYYPATDGDAPDRRTVRRTASGNLRVVKHRASLDSLDSLRQRGDDDVRPYTAPEERPGAWRRGFWHGHSTLGREPSQRSRSSSRSSAAGGRWGMGRILPAGLGSKIGEYGNLTAIPRRLSERRREKRSRELRGKISGPREVRDGVGDVIRRDGYRDAFTQHGG